MEFKRRNPSSSWSIKRTQMLDAALKRRASSPFSSSLSSFSSLSSSLSSSSHACNSQSHPARLDAGPSQTGNQPAKADKVEKTETKEKTEKAENRETIYVLECKDGRYYCGETSNLAQRLEDHRNNKVGWTTLYPMVRLLECKPKRTDFDELTTTLDYMRRYSIDRVRGANFVSLFLTNEQRATIQAQLDAATKKCFSCHQSNHFASTCPFSSGSSVLSNSPAPSAFHLSNAPTAIKPITKPIKQSNEKSGCFRCGRSSHWARDCFAKFDVNGRKL